MTRKSCAVAMRNATLTNPHKKAQSCYLIKSSKQYYVFECIFVKKRNKQTKYRLMKEKKRGRGGLLKKATSELKAYWRGEVIQREDLIELF